MPATLKRQIPLISVIIPAYNMAAFLERALASCGNAEQYVLEIIVVDDGSTDDTNVLIERVAARDKRIVALHQRNRGLSAARNRALGHVTGNYVALLDADDEFCPGWLSLAVRTLEENPSLDGVYGDYLICDDVTGVATQWKVPHRLTLDTLLRDNALPVTTLLLRTKLYRRVGTFDESLPTHEDWQYWLRAAASGWRLAQIDEPSCIIHVHGNNMSRNWRAMAAGRIACLDFAERVFQLSSAQQRTLYGRRAIERFFLALEEILSQSARPVSKDFRILLETLVDLPLSYNRALTATKITLPALILALSIVERLHLPFPFGLPLLARMRRWSHLAPFTNEGQYL